MDLEVEWEECGDGAFRPDFPASSPFVTAVGGTVLQQEGTLGAERAWASGGGGFSNIFSRPSYQDAAVNAYLVRANLPDQQHWNASGRAYPDVSALAGSSLDGQGYCVSVDGKSFNGFTGTSASTPVWAAVIARLNGLRLAAGKPPLGFLNPALYNISDSFNDIVAGRNDANTGIGFNATTGFDAATGLGTINWGALSEKLMS